MEMERLHLPFKKTMALFGDFGVVLGGSAGLMLTLDKPALVHSDVDLYVGRHQAGTCNF